MDNINLTNLTANVNNIQALSDRPNTADGLTSQELKERFDKAGADIKDYINNTHNEEVEAYLRQAKTHIESAESTISSHSSSIQSLTITTADLNTTVTNNTSSINTLNTKVGTIENNYVQNTDSRLTNSRQCNNNFDNWSTARGNLHISSGTSLPSSATNGDIFLLY